VKPPRFRYDDPDTLAEVLDLLARHGDGAKVLAGGQSLMPMLNFRLARPSHVIDINRVDGLSGVAVSEDGLRLGALVR
jgi:CO/xanthine dehydrogenase FAD-binding subunit